MNQVSKGLEKSRPFIFLKGEYQMKKKVELKGIDFIISLPVGVFVNRASSKILKEICNTYDLGPVSYAGSGLVSFLIGFNMWTKASWRAAAVRTGIIRGLEKLNDIDNEEVEEDGNSES